jgi:hypothetical protein
MPSTNHTDTLGLNLWEPADKPTRSDFCADNTALETAYVQHVNDTQLHKTKEDKALLKMGTYTGDGKQVQNLDLTNVQYGIVFEQNNELVSTQSDGTIVLRFAFIVPGLQQRGASILSGKLYVTTEQQAQNGILYDLNGNSRTYQYIAIQ